MAALAAHAQEAVLQTAALEAVSELCAASGQEMAAALRSRQAPAMPVVCCGTTRASG